MTTMTELHVPFPDAWAVLRVGEAGAVDRNRLAAAMASLGTETQSLVDSYAGQIGQLLESTGLAALATLVVPAPDPGDEAAVWCLLQSVGPVATDTAALVDLVVRNPFPVVDDNPDPTILQGRLGTIAKAVQFRPNPALADHEGHWPYGASVRYVLPTGPSSVTIAQFETLSLGYLPDLEEHFDAIMTHSFLT